MISNRLKLLRGTKTQEEVSQHIGIPRARYSHYENNRTEPNYETLVNIANYFGVSLDFLFERTNEAFAIFERSEHTQSNALFDVSGLSEEDIDFINVSIDYLKKRGKILNLGGKEYE